MKLNSFSYAFVEFFSHRELCRSQDLNQLLAIGMDAVELLFRNISRCPKQSEPIRCFQCFLVCDGDLRLKIRRALCADAFFQIRSDAGSGPQHLFAQNELFFSVRKMPMELHDPQGKGKRLVRRGIPFLHFIFHLSSLIIPRGRRALHSRPYCSGALGIHFDRQNECLARPLRVLYLFVSRQATRSQRPLAGIETRLVPSTASARRRLQIVFKPCILYH